MTIEWGLDVLQKAIEEICFQQRLVEIPLSYEDLPIFVIFRYPSRHVTRLANLAETKALYKAKKDKIMTEKEMDALMRERGIWKEEE